MSGLFDVLVILAVVILVVVRQFRARQISADRRWWVVPGVLIFISLREPGLFDAHHPAESAALLAAELLIGLATGAGWAWTTRVWMAPDGAVWSKSTKASVLVWLAGIGLRLGLFGTGALLGVHQGTAALMLALAVTLLVRSGILVWRSQSLSTAVVGVPSHGEGVSPRSWKWKERV
ncbi:DUF1453 domain-containing protein [Streptomyces sp. NPDC002896]|uniref:DUF1453 domain-containing protein n=1 Tax=Streptomyces sp. NPDC002896 TaxID=3154438 RepID=UPI0033336A16